MSAFADQFVARVKLGKATGKGPYAGSTRQLTVPAIIAVQLTEGALFDVILRDDGILYRIVTPETEAANSIPLPDWLNGSA